MFWLYRDTHKVDTRLSSQMGDRQERKVKEHETLVSADLWPNSPRFDPTVESFQSVVSCQKAEVTSDIFTDKHLRHKTSSLHLDIYIQIYQPRPHKNSHHVTVRKQLIQRLSGLLYLHGDSDPLLLWYHVVVHVHLLDHLNLFISISALRNLNY